MEGISSEVIKLTKRLIDIESTNPGSYEKKLADFVCGYFENNGVCVEKSEVWPKRYNVRAILPGRTKEAALVFICHMDTVVKGDGWTKKAFITEETEDRLYGRGACDMKSGLACAISVFLDTAEKIKKEHITLERPFVFIGTVDEEGDMTGVEKVIMDGWVSKDDLIVDMEPTDGQIQMAHKGRTWFEIDVKGITAHASMPEKGADAIAGMAEVISYIRKQMQRCPVHSELGKSTVTFGMVEGGYSPYVVPDYCKVTVDMRLVPPMNTKKAEELVRAAIEFGQQEVQGIECSYRITGDRPSVETYRDSLLMKELRKAVEDVTGDVAEVSAFPGYTDTAVIAGKLHNKNCMSYGPGKLKLAHKPDEYVDKVDIERCYKVFKELVENLLTERRAL